MKCLIMDVLVEKRMPPTAAIALHSQEKKIVRIALLHDQYSRNPVIDKI